MINATQNSELNSEDKQNSAKKPVEIKTLEDISHTDSQHLTQHRSHSDSDTATSSNPEPVTNSKGFPPQTPNKPKKKFNVRTLVGVVVLALLIIGSGAGFYLTQFTQQDIRQQAYLGQSCSVDSNCSGWPNEVCQNGTCVAANQNPTCPAFSAWGSCDPTPGTDENECTGSHYTASECTLGYIEWRCGNKQWIPDYGNPNNNQCAGDCPWPLTNGVCCPTGGDQCDPAVDNYKCIADPYVSECVSWNNSQCPSPGYWKAIEWCVGDGCECGPGGLFEDYSGPGCDCGGSSVTCNEQCSSNSECQEVNSNWFCDPASNRCRLQSNPSSTTCQSGGGGISCNDSCTSNSQCQAVNSNWFCDPASNKCRLQSNPGSTSCQPGTSNLQCNDACTSNNQCPTGTACLTTYDFSANWVNGTSNVSGVGSGTITGFDSFTRNNVIEQYLVRGGKIWHRPNFSTAWSDVTSNVSNVGSGTITSFNVYVTTSGAVEQWLVRGGKIWHRPNLSSQFQDITSNVSGVGSGEIVSYNVEKYSQNHGNIISAYLIRGGKVWHHTSSNWNLWQDVTSNVTSVGSGTITDIGFVIQPSNGELIHHLVRNGQLWSRTAPLASQNRCRLPSYPNSGSCQPPTGSLTCNSTCSSNSQCAAVNPAWSCVSNKCRLTDNPSSTTCEPASEEKTFNISTQFICPDGSTPSGVERRLAWRIWPPTSAVWNYNPKLDFGGVTTNISQSINIPNIYEVSNQSMYIALVEGSLFHTWWTDGDDDLEPYQPIQDPAYPAIEAGDFFEEPMFRIKVADPSVPENITLSFRAPEEVCSGSLMCQDVAILDQENNELIPTATPNPFYVGQIIKFRCAADDPSSPLIEKFEFRLTEPDGTIVEGADINPGGKSAISQNYQITENGTFSAQCRICETNGTCQPYVSIGGAN